MHALVSDDVPDSHHGGADSTPLRLLSHVGGGLQYHSSPRVYYGSRRWPALD